jgi:hypothetical protein
MKTITIPKRFGYPTLDITVNGKVYTVKSGEEITIEDHLAEVIENAIALAPKLGRNTSKIAQLAEGSIPELTFSDLDGVETIVYCAFAQCYSLKRVEIPNSVTKIRKNAFTACTDLKSVIFGDNSKLNSIEESAFYWCTALESVYLPEIPPTLANVSAFQDVNADCVFYCKTQESLEAYQSATNWSELAKTYSFAVR